MQENWVRTLHQEDPLAKEMATQSSTVAWKIPQTEKPMVHGIAKSRTRLSDFTFTFTRSFQQSGTDVRAGLERGLSDEELMLSNCGAGEGS